MIDFEKIRAEEVYRAKVRGRLESRTPKQSKILAFLNTNFGLFLLSTVFISSFSWGFNAWLTHERELKEAKKDQQKLGLEIMNRLRYLDELRKPFAYNERHAIETAISGFNARANVNPSWIPHYSSVFPEYQERSLMSLVWQLETLSTGSTREKLKSVHRPIETAGQYLERLEYKKINAPDKNPEGIIETLELSENDSKKFESEVLNPLGFLREPTYFEHH
jgi:hypothetical protein